MRAGVARWPASLGLLALAMSGCGSDPSLPSSARLTQSPAPATAAGSSSGAATAAAPLDEVPPLHPSVDDYPEADVTLVPGDGEPITIPVKVADTPERRGHGLMEVTALPAGTGMLFTYAEDSTGAFYMKDTLVPLDIAFVDADGEIVATFAMDPCESEPCPTYGPDEAFRAALEVPQGWLDEAGLDAGDTITWGEVEPAA